MTKLLYDLKRGKSVTKKTEETKTESSVFKKMTREEFFKSIGLNADDYEEAKPIEL